MFSFTFLFDLQLLLFVSQILYQEVNNTKPIKKNYEKDHGSIIEAFLKMTKSKRVIMLTLEKAEKKPLLNKATNMLKKQTVQYSFRKRNCVNKGLRKCNFFFIRQIYLTMFWLRFYSFKRSNKMILHWSCKFFKRLKRFPSKHSLSWISDFSCWWKSVFISSLVLSRCYPLRWQTFSFYHCMKFFVTVVLTTDVRGSDGELTVSLFIAYFLIPFQSLCVIRYIF